MGLVLALLAYFDVSTALAEGAVMPSWASLVMFALVTCTLVTMRLRNLETLSVGN